MTVDHVVVLCLENRSFDHMLGFLRHPDPTYQGLLGGGVHGNRGSDGKLVEATPDAKSVIPYGPDHSHDAVMQQLGYAGISAAATNQGFVRSYELKASGRSPSTKGGLIADLMRRFERPTTNPAGARRGPLVMRCMSPERVPVLTTLAREFAVCDNWFCSVPGETWPNRNYLHAATSDGEVNIEIRPYRNRTIFELLEDNGRDWRIYHDDTPQVWAFPRLWDSADRHAKWFPMERFYGHVAAGDLPPYTFIEPNHRPPVHTVDRLSGASAAAARSDSQHPENNLVSDAAYDGYVDDVPTDFERGEQLIARIYEALRANAALFERTVLVITYDEHGGWYDHVPTTARVPAPGRVHASLPTRVMHRLWRTNATAFDFTTLGVRVPTVVVSPLIEAAKVDHTAYEHASVPATLRRIFAPHAEPLTARDAVAATFDSLWTGSVARTDLPDLSQYAAGPAATAPVATAAVAAAEPGDTERDWVPDYYREFVSQADEVRRHLQKVREPETEGLGPITSPEDGHAITQEFQRAAERHRGARGTSSARP